MRLIDADELKELFPDKGEGAWTYNVTARMYIDNAPIVDERSQGEWKYDININYWKCTKCSGTPNTIGYCGSRDFMIERFKYCPNCGSKMEGAKE